MKLRRNRILLAVDLAVGLVTLLAAVKQHYDENRRVIVARAINSRDDQEENETEL